MLKENFAIIAARILVEHIPFFREDFKGLVPSHISYPYSSEMAKRSEVVSYCIQWHCVYGCVCVCECVHVCVCVHVHLCTDNIYVTIVGEILEINNFDDQRIPLNEELLFDRNELTGIV